MKRGRKWAVAAIVLPLAAFMLVMVASLVLWFTASRPDTPGNAVLDFGSDVVLRDYNGAWSRLCLELKAEAFAEAKEDFTRVASILGHSGNISTNYATDIDGDAAIEPITVRPRGVLTDRSNEQWVVHLVKSGTSGGCVESSRPRSERHSRGRQRLFVTPR